MTRQIINIGTGPDSYTGDNLRTAFTKVNDNFAQLYAGNVGANTTINVLTANAVSTNGNVYAGNVIVQYQVVYNGNISAPYFVGNGRYLTGVLVSANLGNLSIGGPNNLTISGSVAGNIVLDPAGDGNVSIVSDVIPGANVTYNLGSSTRQWKDLWLSNSTLYLGGFPVTVSNTGALSVNGSPVTSSYGNANVTAFLPTYSGLLGGTLSTVSQPNITAVGTLTSLTATNDITTTSGRFIGNGSGLTAITGANVNGTVANATYTVTAQFVTGLTGANVTTALGYVPLNSNSANTYSNTNVAAYLTRGTSLIPGVTLAGNIFAGPISGSAAEPGFRRLTTNDLPDLSGNISSYLPTYTGNIAGNIVKNDYTWTFGTDGNLALPAGGVLLVSGGIAPASLITSPAPYLSGFGSISSQTMTATGNISGNYILGNGSQLTGLSATYSNTNVASYLPTYTGNISSGNISTGVITLTNGAVIRDTAGDAIAYGRNAGLTSQGSETVAIGVAAGSLAQGTGAVAIGSAAGLTNQGTNSIAIGRVAGSTNQATNSIILNATGTVLDQTTANTFTVAPVRNDVANVSQVMFYNTTSKEVTYGNTISVAGNISGAALTSNASITAITTISALGGLQATPIGNVVGRASSGSFTTITANGNLTVSAVSINNSATVGTTLGVTGNVTVGGNLTVTGNITGNVATTFQSTWTVPTGNSTQSFTVNSGTYSMWVDCNITNGILVWNATATVTNTNVPVVGYQYAWVYNGGGTPIDFTSIPNQFTGTANTIVRSNTAPSATTNRFDFGINNTSGGNVTVRYGWTKIS